MRMNAHTSPQHRLDEQERAFCTGAAKSYRGALAHTLGNTDWERGRTGVFAQKRLVIWSQVQQAQKQELSLSDRRSEGAATRGRNGDLGLLRRGGKNTEKNYTKTIFMTQIITMV